MSIVSKNLQETHHPYKISICIYYTHTNVCVSILQHERINSTIPKAENKADQSTKPTYP